MDNMDDLDALMDNFFVKTFWQRKKLAHILVGYGLYMALGTLVMVKAILDSSNAGAVPKTFDIKDESKNWVVR